MKTDEMTERFCNIILPPLAQRWLIPFTILYMLNRKDTVRIGRRRKNDETKGVCMKDWVDIYMDACGSSYEGVEAVRELVQFFGGYIYDRPDCEGTDTYGYIVSKRRLTNAEIQEIMEEENDY